MVEVRTPDTPSARDFKQFHTLAWYVRSRRRRQMVGVRTPDTPTARNLSLLHTLS